MKHFCHTMLVLSFLLAACHSNALQGNNTNTAPSNPDTTQIEGVYHLSLNDMEVWTLQDKVNTMPMSLFPDAEPSIVKELVPSGAAPSAINTFLVKYRDQYILFDAGLGRDKGGAIMDQLEQLKIRPQDINIICITHFHGDHIGGMVVNGKACFPNAEVYFSEAEAKAWASDPATKQMMNLYQGRTHAFTAGDTLLDFIVTKAAPGHTPGHTLYQINQLLVIGDLLHAAALQLPHPEYCARYDQDKKTAVETRNTYYKYIRDNHLIVAGMHLPGTGVMERFPEEMDIRR